MGDVWDVRCAVMMLRIELVVLVRMKSKTKTQASE